MSIGYFADLADAEDYFALERLTSEAWDDLGSGSGGGLKDRVIRQAPNRLYHDGRWGLPTYATASASDLVKLRIANAEMAYYLCIHLADEDRRKGIQAQGVIEAGIVKEKYAESMLMEVPIPPAVIAMIDSWTTDSNFAAVEIERDEEEEDLYF